MATRLMNSKFDGLCKVCGGKMPAGTRILWAPGAGAKHADPATCAASAAARAALPPTPAVTLNLKPIADFLLAAKARGLKWPKARFLAPGGGEMRLTIAGDRSKAPGSVNVKLGDDWIGRVEPDGRVTPRLADRADLVSTLTAIATDPAKFASEYGALMGNCSFCNKSLTAEGSTDVGYGPVCARKFGLPYTARPTPTLTEFSEAA